jgi:DNA helicase-2/ATP-dependent DNA helicase PcrA
MLDLNLLNKAQKEAVITTDGPMMILAGAGSGKTRTLVTKIAHLIENKNISTFQILGLTFSNKAALEMRERIASQVSINPGALKVTTFHSFCAQVLRTEANYLGLSRNFTIYDESESKAIIKSLIKKRGISTKELSPYEVLYYINDLKNNSYYIGSEHPYFHVDTLDGLYGYFQEYEAELSRGNAVDFGGLITGVIQLFEKYPQVLEVYQNRFKYILVDEYQDTNKAQFELIKLLSAKEKNLCVVGDEDQSIYSWRGADIRNILEFEEFFPDAKTLKLEQNYRSSKMIIEAASCVIEKNAQRKGKKMWTENPSGSALSIVECLNDKKEADFVSQEIKKIHRESLSDGEKASYGDMAIFYRANSQARLIEDSLRKNNIPYRIIGGVKFYDRKEIKDLLAYLRIVVNEKDSLALSRIINTPSRGIGAVTLRKLEDEAIRTNVSLLSLIQDIVENSEKYKHIRLGAKVKSSLKEFAFLIAEVTSMSNDGDLPSLIYEKILHESGYWQSLKMNKDYESLARLDNLQELTNAIKQFEETKERPNLIGFLETLSLDSSSSDISDNDIGSANTRVEDRGEVSLMTVHGAKGLEFPYVFLAGAEENVFPSYQSLENGDSGIEEERRLFYVAMTRGMKKLYITFAQGRMLFGSLRFNGPSRFINEIPSHFYKWTRVDNEISGDQFKSSWDDENFSQEINFSDEKIYQVKSTYRKSKFPKGTKVIHSLYGEGKVQNSEGINDDEKVLVKFLDGSLKRFMVKFAPLEKI